MADELPGFTSRLRVVSRGKGRHRQAVASLAKLLRSSESHDEHREAHLILAYSLADSLDRQEHDPQASEHVMATTSRAMLDVLAHLVPTIAPAADPAALIAAAIAQATQSSADPSAVRDPAPS